MQRSDVDQNINNNFHCPKCAIEVKNDTNFCPACGFSIIRYKKELLNQKKEASWIGVKSILIFYCILFFSFLSLLVIPKIRNTFLGAEIIAWFDLGIVFLYLWYDKPANLFFNYNSHLIKSIGVVLSLLAISILFNVYYHKSILFLFNVNIENETDLNIENGHSILYLIFYNCFLPAFSEELAFRAIIYEKFKKILPISEAMLLTGLLFGILHLNFYSAPYLCLLGVTLCWLKEYSKSIIFCMAFHFLHNFIVEFYL